MSITRKYNNKTKKTMSYFRYDSLEESIRSDVEASDLSLTEKMQAVIRVLEYLAFCIDEPLPNAANE